MYEEIKESIDEAKENIRNAESKQQIISILDHIREVLYNEGYPFEYQDIILPFANQCIRLKRL